MPTPPPPTPPPPGPLSPDHLRILSQARQATRKIRRAAGVAALSGWTMAIFAAFSLLFALTGDWLSLIVGLALGAIAFVELRGGSMLRRLNLRGPKLLVFNQTALAILIVSYALWSLYTSLKNPSLQSLSGASDDPQINAMVTQLTSTITYGLYGTLAVFGIVAPALTAWYYGSRARLIRRVLAETPPWAIEAINAAS